MPEFILNLDEAITIGDLTSDTVPIEVTVADLTEHRVHLGITAPTEVQVHRLEVWEDIREHGRRG